MFLKIRLEDLSKKFTGLGFLKALESVVPWITTAAVHIKPPQRLYVDSHAVWWSSIRFIRLCNGGSLLQDVSSNERKNDVISFQPPTSFGKRMSTNDTSIKVMQNHKSPAAPQIKPFSLILPKSTNSKSSGKKQVEIEDSLESSSNKVLGPGMVLLKNHVSLSKQVEIVNKCEELGAGRGGFYQPGFGDGGKLNLQMMCLGRNWDPQTRYDKRYRSDGSEAPPIPDQLIGIAKNALEVSRSLTDNEWDIPLMSPDICIVNFYTTSGRLGLHQDRDESSKSLSKGLPVVSVSIGDSANFLYGDSRVVKKAANILLESGDVLIFGGKSRHIFHGVETIIPDSAPEALLKQTMLRPGRLNLTFRQF